jgi:hypothetical protein
LASARRTYKRGGAIRQANKDSKVILLMCGLETKTLNSIRFETFDMGPFEGADSVILSRKAIFVKTIIDNRPLLEIITDYEAPFFFDKSNPELGYGYQYVDELYRYLTEKEYRDFVGVGLLICGGCLNEGCWPLFCAMEETSDTVVWSGFYNPHLNGEWGGEPDVDYSGLGPFEFDKKRFRAHHRFAFKLAMTEFI